MLRTLTDSELAHLSEMRATVKAIRSALNTIIGRWFSPWRNVFEDSTLVGWDESTLTSEFINVMTVGPMVFCQYDIEGADDGATVSCSFTLPYALRDITGFELRAVGQRAMWDGLLPSYAHNTIYMAPGSNQVILHASDQDDPNGWDTSGIMRSVWGQFWFLR